MNATSQTDPSGSFSASTSLLRCAKQNQPEAWKRLIAIYGPLVYRWSRQAGLQPADAEDMVGEVFVDLVKGVEKFQADGSPHSFRRWLRTIASRKVHKHRRKTNSQPFAGGGTTANVRLQKVASEGIGVEEDPRDEVDWVRQQAAKILQEDCNPKHWQVFQRTVLDGETAEEVAAAIGMSVWGVYKVRSRLLHRLRSELDELS